MSDEVYSRNINVTALSCALSEVGGILLTLMVGAEHLLKPLG